MESVHNSLILLKRLGRHVDYPLTHPNTKVQYYASIMCLPVNTDDATYLVQPNAHGRYAFFSISAPNQLHHFLHLNPMVLFLLLFAKLYEVYLLLQKKQKLVE